MSVGAPRSTYVQHHVLHDVANKIKNFVRIGVYITSRNNLAVVSICKSVASADNSQYIRLPKLVRNETAFAAKLPTNCGSNGTYYINVLKQQFSYRIKQLLIYYGSEFDKIAPYRPSLPNGSRVVRKSPGTVDGRS